MKLWMCRNCPSDATNGASIPGYKFYSEKPVCPNCGADRANPRHAHYIGECAVIHFDAPDPILHDRGVNVAACDPKIKIGSSCDGPIPHFGTASRDAVTCQACMETEVFKSGVEGGSTLKAK